MTLKMLRAIPALPVTSIDASVSWYSDFLQLTPAHHETGFAICRRDDVELHLWTADDERWRTKALAAGASPVCTGAESFIAGTASCRIAVSDVDAFYAQLDHQIVHPKAQLHDEPWAREFGVIDPDGNLITFFQPR